jgi:hypothetical protein
MENVFKNKDLHQALKVMGELEEPIFVRAAPNAPTIAGCEGMSLAPPSPTQSYSVHTMATQRPTPSTPTDTAQKLRQTQAEYTAARPASQPGVKPMMSSSKMYVCRRCQANFKTGDGKPDARIPGLGKCNACLAATSVAV